ncbi:MAG: VOC family protein [Pseudomonadota bacterium]
MISHVFIGISDFERALSFYSQVMEELGLILKFSEPDRPWAAWVSSSAPRPLFLIGKPYDGQAASVGNGQMIALLAPNRETVNLAYSKAISNGGTCEGPPGLRPQYHENYYGAYFRDPDGNKIGVCCHESQTVICK